MGLGYLWQSSILISVFAVTVISPIELVRTKMQSEQLTYKQVRHAISGTIQHGGVLSLWKGLGPTLLRDVPFSGRIKYTCYT